MPIPTYDEMLRPILAMAEKGEITRRTAAEAMVGYFDLTQEEIASRLPSGGSTYVRNRAGWAMTFLTKAGLIEKAAPRTYRITELGREFLAKYPKEIAPKDLESIPGYLEAWSSARREKKPNSKTQAPDSLDNLETPEETLNRVIEFLLDDVRQRLLEAILAQTPEFFEGLVLDVLLAMGYGDPKDRSAAAQRLGKSGDEGIDGRINQDALGLDQILVQAKRYAPDRPIDRKTIQAFIGSLAGQGVTKGIFITTSYFAQTAHEFVQRGAHTKIVLIDGKDLITRMLRHKIGVRVCRTIEIFELDQNYFEDAE
jgi:restriction system protein